MAGLFDDTEESSMLRMALASGLLGGGWAGGAQAMSKFQLGQQERKDKERERMDRKGLLDAQLEGTKAENEAKRMRLEAEREQRNFRQNLPDPQFLAGQAALAQGVGPTMANAARIPQQSPTSALMYEAVRSGVIGVPDYINSLKPKELPFEKVSPKDFTQESIGEFARSGGDYTKLVPVRKREIAPGGQVYDPYSVQPGQSFADPNKPFSIGADNKPAANAAYQQYELQKAATGAPRTTVDVNTGQKGLDNELKIRSDFRSEPIYKAHQDVISAHAQITQALKQASPAGDLAGATKLMKILDPGSVVRESELGMAMAASGAMDRLQHYATNIVNGTKLTPTQRADFQSLSDKLLGESNNQFKAKRAEYGQIAGRYGLDVEGILGPEPKAPKVMDQRPAANASNKGKRVQNTETGEWFRSNGLSWVKE